MKIFSILIFPFILFKILEMNGVNSFLTRIAISGVAEAIWVWICVNYGKPIPCDDEDSEDTFDIRHSM